MVSDNEPRYRLLDSSGAVVGTIYERADGSLALQEATSENEIVLRQDGDITAVGSVLRRLGHDEVDVPQTFDLVTDDFERASLGSDYVGDVSDAQIQSSVALEGSRSLEISLSSGDESHVGTNESYSPELGDRFEIFYRLTDNDDRPFVGLLSSNGGNEPRDGSAIRLEVNAADNRFELRQFTEAGGSASTSASIDLSPYVNETLRVEGELGLDREVTARLFDNTGNELASVSETLLPAMPESGGVTYVAFNQSTASTQYFDGPFIDRRVPQETRERQRGAAETSKLQTRGGVGAGPRILPENRAAAVMADQGVTADVSAGTEVSYGLQLNGDRVLKVRGEADGSGGIQNAGVDVNGVGYDYGYGLVEAFDSGDVTNNADGDNVISFNNLPSASGHYRLYIQQSTVREKVQLRVNGTLRGSGIYEQVLEDGTTQTGRDGVTVSDGGDVHTQDGYVDIFGSKTKSQIADGVSIIPSVHRYQHDQQGDSALAARRGNADTAIDASNGSLDSIELVFLGDERGDANASYALYRRAPNQLR